jgi:polyhydroxybutyrate depolymerase
MRIRPLWIAAMAVLLPLAGCGSDEDGEKKPEKRPAAQKAPKETPRPGDHTVTMTWQGKTRFYTVHAPPGYTAAKRLPLVIAMHPYPADRAYAARLTGFNAKADKEGFLVAYPDGLAKAYNALVCCGAEDDVGFIGAMTERLVSTWKADPQRIYATGISNGGDMSFKLAVEVPDTFAAIAPVSGGYIGLDAAKPAYMPKSPVSVVTFIGGMDQHHDDFERGITAWTERLSCTAGRPDKVKGSNVTRTSARCRDTSDVIAYRLPDMGHSWPGSTDPTMGAAEAGVDATDLIWEFFAAHPKISS